MRGDKIHLLQLIYFKTPLIFLDTCISVKTDNITVLDHRLYTCVDVPVDRETDGILKLFSLSVGPECAKNKSHVIVSLQYGNIISETTCNDNIGLLASNGTECAGSKVCEVSFYMLSLCGNRDKTVQFVTKLTCFSASMKYLC